MRAGMGDVTNRYSRGKNTPHRLNLVDAIFELPESDLESARELARLRGGHQSSRHSLVEASSDHALEIAGRSMKRRLGYVELARRRIEGTAFCDRGEGADVRIGSLVLHRFRRLAT